MKTSQFVKVFSSFSFLQNIITTTPTMSLVLPDNDRLLDVMICVPNHFIKKIRVSPDSPISFLNTFFQKEKKVYIHNGQILSQDKTFESLEINKNGHIIALTQKELPTFEYEISRWIRTTSDPGVLSQRITNIGTKKTHQENARIRDLRLQKLEQKKNFYPRRIYNQMEHSGASQYQMIPLNLDFPIALAPNEEPLPVLW